MSSHFLVFVFNKFLFQCQQKLFSFKLFRSFLSIFFIARWTKLWWSWWVTSRGPWARASRWWRLIISLARGSLRRSIIILRLVSIFFLIFLRRLKNLTLIFRWLNFRRRLFTISLNFFFVQRDYWLLLDWSNRLLVWGLIVIISKGLILFWGILLRSRFWLSFAELFISSFAIFLLST